MAANRNLLIRALALSALRQKTQTKTPVSILEDVVLGKFDSEIKDGKTVISSNEAGGTVTFQMMGDFGPDEILSLVMETIVWIRSQPDPTNYDPYPKRGIKRLRISFAKASL